MAPIYDEFNAGNDYELWLGEVLLPELGKHGLKTGRALDVGCGTGRAFGPLRRRGWVVDGCDVSPEMIARARDKYRGEVEGLCLADARELPRFVGAPYDLIISLNDVVNYLVEDGDLERCFSGVVANLAPGGLVCFDANTLGLFRSAFAGEGMDRGDWTWRGTSDRVTEGGIFEAVVSGPGVDDNLHRQRHWTEDEIRDALDVAGLTCLARLGHFEDVAGGVTLNDPADDERDLKAIHIAGHRG
jgi:SAM-dependent methyltransferase